MQLAIFILKVSIILIVDSLKNLVLASTVQCTSYSPSSNPIIITQPFTRFDSQIVENVPPSQIANTSYQGNADCTWIFQPPIPSENTTVPFIIDFLSFELEEGYDAVNIYNGSIPTGDSPLLTLTGVTEVAVYFNFDDGGNYTYIFMGVSRVMVVFTSDGDVNYDGFSALYYVPSKVESVDRCLNDCSNNGVCLNGRCKCYNGIEGGDCRRDDASIILKIASSCKFSQWTSCGKDWDLNVYTLKQVCGWSCLDCYSGRISRMEFDNSNLDCFDPGSNTSNLATLQKFPKYCSKVNMNNNRIGAIPKALYNTADLKTFEFRNTSLSGSLPPNSLTAATSLKVLDLSENSLSGVLDPLFRRLTGLSQLNLENNLLGGFYIEDFQYLPPNSIRIAGNFFWCPMPHWNVFLTYNCVNITLFHSSISSGNQNGGYNVSIKGQNIPQQIPVYCAFDGTKALQTYIISTTEIICTVPPSPAKTSQLTISYSGEQASTNSLEFTFVNYCPMGTFAVNASTCEICPNGSRCTGELQIPLPQNDFVRSNKNPLSFVPCYFSGVCVGESLINLQTNTHSDYKMNATNITTYFSNFSWTPICKEGFTGQECSQCDTGWFFTGDTNDPCKPCSPKYQKLIAFGLVLLLFLAFSLVFYFASQSSKFASTYTVFNFLQFSGLFLHYHTKWSPILNKSLSFFSAFDLNLEQVGLECAFGVNFFSKFDMMMLMPVWTVAFVVIYWSVITGWYFWRHRLEWWPLTVRFKDSIIRGVIMLCIFVHIPITKTGLTLFVCQSNENRRFLLNRPEIDCDTPEFQATFPKAVFIIIFYGLGIPLLFLLTTMYLSYKKILYDPGILRRYGPMYLHYRSVAHYWETLHLLLHLLLLMIPTFLNEFQYLSVFMVSCTLTIYSILLLRFKPFRFVHANLMCVIGYSTFPILLMAGVISESFYETDLVARTLETTETHFYSFELQTISIITVVYHIFCLIVLLHGFLFELQFEKYIDWVKMPGFKNILESKTYKFFFPKHADHHQLDYIQFRRPSNFHAKSVTHGSHLSIAKRKISDVEPQRKFSGREDVKKNTIIEEDPNDLISRKSEWRSEYVPDYIGET
ncbi:Multiple epidermal growth factor-like domains protein 8 [Nowakowskiella sp. JEL0407]|nr:Multiple epidermal growth factor-like domains protein 8 [Nowakowskiella sp. JEL0407]